jgi:hypothetical protein
LSILILCVLALTIPILSPTLPYAVDWITAFRPAIREMAALRTPYSVDGYFNPAWALILLAPFAALPEPFGRAALLLASIAGFVLVGIKAKARPFVIGAFMVSPPVLQCLLNGNIDWLPLLGFFMPPTVGLFFVLLKPQVGIVIAVFWLVEAWRKGGIVEVGRVFLPVSMAFAFTFLLFGFWPIAATPVVNATWNASLWPYLVPLGLVLIVAAIRGREARFAMAASPCLSPYVALQSWSAVLVAILPLQTEALVAIAGLWLVAVFH